MGQSFVRTPPDSTGKRVKTLVTIELDYDNGTVDFAVGDVVVGGSSGVEGTVISFSGTTAAGTLILIPSDESSVVYTDNESLEVLGSEKALANGTGTPVYTQRVVSASGDNPDNVQKIDNQGSSYVRYTDGPQLLDAFGKTQVSQVVPLGIYSFPYDASHRLIDYTTEVNGTYSYNSNNKSILLSVDTTIGSSASLSSRKYHPVINSSGQEVLISALLGDTGKYGKVVRLGYFDQLNGVFFEQTGSNNNIVLRSNASGAVVETRVSQSAWNGDDSLTLDPNTINKYYFDLNQYGKIRFGVFNQNRTILHTFDYFNTNQTTILGKSSLPSRVELENEDTTVSTSEVSVFGMNVISQGFTTREHLGEFNTNVGNTSFVSFSGSSPSHIFSIRLASTYKGLENRKIAIFNEIHGILTGSVIGPVQIKVYKDGTLSGGSWVAAPAIDSSLEYNESATYMTGTGFEVYNSYIDFNHFEIDTGNDSNILTEFLALDTHATGSSTYTLTANVISGTQVMQLHSLFSMKEYG